MHVCSHREIPMLHITMYVFVVVVEVSLEVDSGLHVHIGQQHAVLNSGAGRGPGPAASGTDSAQSGHLRRERQHREPRALGHSAAPATCARVRRSTLRRGQPARGTDRSRLRSLRGFVGRAEQQRSRVHSAQTLRRPFDAPRRHSKRTAHLRRHAEDERLDTLIESSVCRQQLPGALAECSIAGHRPV